MRLGAVLHDADEAGSNCAACSVEQRGIVEGRERRDAKPVALPREHAERGRADRSGRPEDRDAAACALAGRVTPAPT